MAHSFFKKNFKTNHDWFKIKGYIHLTKRYSIEDKPRILNYVSNPKSIKEHRFTPFLLKSLKVRKYKVVDKETGKRAHSFSEAGKVKQTAKVRSLLYCSHLDGHVYSYYSKEILEPLYEKLLKADSQLNMSISAYRKIPIDGVLEKNKGSVHFAKEAFDEIKRRGECTAVLLDIENFFPSLDHRILKLKWAELLGKKSLPGDHYNLFKSITRFSYVLQSDLKMSYGGFDEKAIAQNRAEGVDSFFSSFQEFLESDIVIYKNPDKNKGIPLGLPVSALLANLYMLDFDRLITDTLVREHDVFYRRYSDDIIIICDNELQDMVKSLVFSEIQKIELKVSEEKTEIFKFIKDPKTQKLTSWKKNGENNFSKGVPLLYLGFEFYGYQTLIKSRNLSRFYGEMKESVKMKIKRAEQSANRDLLDKSPVFKRKIYRLYSYKGIKARQKVKGNKTRLYRGNFIAYAHRASNILEAPEIRRQIRNHFKILKKTLNSEYQKVFGE